ncbi:17.8 kDa class I heat shock protein-like [Aristolochia californica]|uniref:17.8 kDa class I heat shock protein-like n=1 Tax=Aristolochia californica TaxID=171875 RepID=UPI0035DAADFD
MSVIPSFFGTKTNIYDPFDLFDHGFPFNKSLSPMSTETSAFANTHVDWRETPEAHIFKADLPGVNKDEIKVEVKHENILQISGQRSKEFEEKNGKWHRMERSSGGFLRRFSLPDNAKVERMKASVENGVLTVTVPKGEDKKTKLRPK